MVNTEIEKKKEYWSNRDGKNDEYIQDQNTYQRRKFKYLCTFGFTNYNENVSPSRQPLKE